MISIQELTIFFVKIFEKIIDIVLNKIESNNKKFLYIKEEDMKIDCYEFLKQISKTNKSVMPLRFITQYYIDNSDYIEDEIFEARCMVNSFSSYDFSIVSTTLKKYEECECIGYDLMNSPDVPIRPKLISPDSFSKRLSLQLNKMLNKNDILKIHLKYKSYGSMTESKRYIIRGLNYKKISLSEYNISFSFMDRIPNNIRVYEVNPFKNTYRFLYKIFPDTSNDSLFSDTSHSQNIRKHNKYIYVF